jgi:hypothetical protein
MVLTDGSSDEADAASPRRQLGNVIEAYEAVLVLMTLGNRTHRDPIEGREAPRGENRGALGCGGIRTRIAAKLDITRDYGEIATPPLVALPG